MQREEKQYEMALNTIQSRLLDLRNAIGAMIHTLDTECDNIYWPTFLDNFALISSHLSSFNKCVSKDLCPPLRNRTVLPLLLCQERDEHLLQLTQGRVPAFAHDIVPDYLRTKPDPVVEQKMIQNEQKAANLSAETAVKQVTQYHKVTTHLWEMVSKAHEDWEIEVSSRPGIQQTSSMADTHALAAAIGCGKGLKPGIPEMPGQSSAPGGGNMMVPPAIRNVNPNPMPKGAPPIIKTNIKAAMSVHSYNR